MGKQLTVTDTSGKTYTLEYNRRAVQYIESKGFNAAKVDTMPATMIPLLVEGAFFKNHRGMKGKTVDDIYENISGKEGFIEAILEMYTETLEALLDEPKGNKGKNALWTKSW